MFAVILSIHIIICVFLIVLVLLQRSEGGGLGIGQSGSSGGLGDFLSTRSTSNILTKTTSFLAFCFFLTSFSLVLISNSTYKKESIIDSSEDSIIDRLDLIPEEFDVENEENDEELSVPSE
tara:strand:+ start:25 stop:387 length:363 start_codon:yes stop_codon:yes gene_type:complete